MEQRLQNVLVPKESVSFKLQLNESWRRDYGEFNTVFGLEYEHVQVCLLFKAEGVSDGSIQGSFWMWVLGSLTEQQGEMKKISDTTTWDSEHEFEIGHDDDEVFIIEKKSPIAIRQAFRYDRVGEVLSFVASDFIFRPAWDVKVKLL
jgi:hypothetical protein